MNHTKHQNQEKSPHPLKKHSCLSRVSRRGHGGRLRYLLSLLLLGFLLPSCEKISDEPVFDIQPRIELLELSDSILTQFRDPLRIRIAYEDGDGDLGHSNADINSIFVRDSRLAGEDQYYLAPLAPDGAEISIQGTLNIALPPTFILGNADRETTVFTLYLVDRAGNESNRIETGEISIIKD